MNDQSSMFDLLLRDGDRLMRSQWTRKAWRQMPHAEWVPAVTAGLVTSHQPPPVGWRLRTWVFPLGPGNSCEIQFSRAPTVDDVETLLEYLAVMRRALQRKQEAADEAERIILEASAPSDEISELEQLPSCETTEGR